MIGSDYRIIVRIIYMIQLHFLKKYNTIYIIFFNYLILHFTHMYIITSLTSLHFWKTLIYDLQMQLIMHLVHQAHPY